MDLPDSTTPRVTCRTEQQRAIQRRRKFRVVTQVVGAASVIRVEHPGIRRISPAAQRRRRFRPTRKADGIRSGRRRPDTALRPRRAMPRLSTVLRSSDLARRQCRTTALRLNNTSARLRTVAEAAEEARRVAETAAGAVATPAEVAAITVVDEF